MNTIDEVLSDVESTFARNHPATWPDPHRDHGALEEEYSRITDPERFAILIQRLDAWRQVLTASHDVTVTALEPIGPVHERWTSPRPDTLALDVSVLEIDNAPVVGLSLEQRPEPFEVIPDCACDACDTGSSDLLAALDSVLKATVDGSLVIVTGPADEGLRAGEPLFEIMADEDTLTEIGEGPADPAEIVDAIRSGDDPGLPDGCTVHHGAPWLG